MRKTRFNADSNTSQHAEKRMIKKQKHTYSLEEFGLSEKNINDHLKNYIMNNEF